MNRRVLPKACRRVARQHGIRPTRFLLVVSVATQRLSLFERRRDAAPAGTPDPWSYQFRSWHRVSTSRFGIGQAMDSNRTPLGLHRIARKLGGGHPVGTVFKSRRPIGLTWQGRPDGEIVHRILWLEGLEPGFNRGGDVDTFRRYVYLHGFGDELSLGRPRSSGCVHLSARDLMPLYEQLPEGTLVWICEQ